MKKLYLTFFVVALFTSLSYSQEKQAKKPRTFGCAFDEALNAAIEKDPSVKETIKYMDSQILQHLHDNNNSNFTLKTLNGPPTQNIIVPVVITIIHGGVNEPENISDDQAVSQIEALNNYFSPYGMQFCLATVDRYGNAIAGTTPGIRRVQSTSLSHVNVATELTSLGGQSANFPPGNYLNIYVVNEITNSQGNGDNIVGISSLPGSNTFDGIVMRYYAFGDNSNPLCTSCNLHPEFQLGKVLVHEVGHYFGLYHTFTQGCYEVTAQDCTGEECCLTYGDKVCDTPPVAQQNTGCPSFVDSCYENPNLPDAINNYMDYTHEACQNDFTQGQYERMLTYINLFRSQLISPENLGDVGIACNPSVPLALLANFSCDTYSPCVGTSLAFNAPTILNATYSWDFGDGSAIVTTEDPSHSFAYSSTPYMVTLTITVGTDTATVSKLIYPVNCSPINNIESNWIFSYRNALSFQTGTPLPSTITNTSNTHYFINSCAVQNNASGQLLFYTNGIDVFNSSQLPINSSPLYGHYVSFNGVIIVPDPGNANSYYIFTKSDASLFNNVPHQGFRYTKVDVSGTTPTVNSINTPITIPAGYVTNSEDGAVRGSEGITAIPNCTGGYWIITGLDKLSGGHHMVVYLLDENGLSYNSEFLSPTSSEHDSTFRASPNGNHLISFGIGVNNTYLYDFDKYNGVASNQRYLSVRGGGACFSPDSKLLYAGGYSSQPDNKIFQYDLNNVNVLQSRKVVSFLSSTGDFQLGPDNKIYIGKGYNTDGRLAVIHSPNNIVTNEDPSACQFSLDGPLVQSSSTYALPNLINAKVATAYDNTMTVEPRSCSQYKFFANVCSETFSWNFGDTASGTNNTSTSPVPLHTFSGPGTYNVSLTAGGITLYKTITIGEGADASIVGTTTACVTNNNVTNHSAIVEGGAQSITWSITSGAGTVNGQPNSADVSIAWSSLPGTVQLQVTNASGCATTTSVEVTSYCVGDECAENIVFGVPQTVTTETYSASNSIVTQNNYQVEANSDITLVAASYIQINSNSWIKEDSKFLAKIEDCEPGRPALNTEEITQNELTLYPNPTDGLVHLVSSSYITEVSVYDISGKEIYTLKFDSQPNVEFDISNLQRGLYLVKVSDGENSKAFKVIKQ